VLTGRNRPEAGGGLAGVLGGVLEALAEIDEDRTIEDDLGPSHAPFLIVSFPNLMCLIMFIQSMHYMSTPRWILGLRSHVCTPCRTHAAILTSLFHG
jgi:hypothetical protein